LSYKKQFNLRDEYGNAVNFFHSATKSDFGKLITDTNSILNISNAVMLGWRYINYSHYTMHYNITAVV